MIRKWKQWRLPVRWEQFLFRVIKPKPHTAAFERNVYYELQRAQARRASKLRSKPVLRVGFIILFDSIWKYDRLFRLLMQDDRFDPFVIMAPVVTQGVEAMHRELDKGIQFFTQRGFPVYDTRLSDGNWMDIQEQLKPDLVFFSNPWPLSQPQYEVAHFPETLSAYVPYFFVMNRLWEHNFDKDFHNLVWRNFYETDCHGDYARSIARNRGINVCVTGYPGLDVLYEKDQSEVSPWPQQARPMKRLIIAPHHTIEGQDAGLSYSNFEQYADLFQQLVQDFADTIQFAFKPHPLLRNKLYQSPAWGKAKTDAYFQFWSEQPNTLLCESDYRALFMESDAMIHDSGSFSIEYLTLNKPVLYLLKDDRVFDRLNDVGQEAVRAHQLARSADDIQQFLIQVVQGGNLDVHATQREAFLTKYVIQSKGQMASDMIYQHLIQQLR